MEYRPIRRLSDEVIGQIAAGEVIERPAAAVKELVENSIDAGATAVTVELTDGGLTSLRVSDNGRGIPAEQIRMAFERHATSKLSTAEELFDVRTLGFRGEALASIAAVARVQCVTRARDAAFGVRARVEGGQILEVTEAASPVGTSITVRDLFFNAPVRLKFLKKSTAEAALVSDYILRLILSRPDVAFRFVSQGKTVYRSAGDGTVESALYCAYGREALQAMRRVRGSANGVLLDGYVGIGEQARGNRGHQSFFINARYFRDERLGRALEAACEGFVMIGRYPICALYLQVPYRLVDVNVHPNKLEVRFQNPDAVAGAVQELTREALRAVTLQDRLAGEPLPAVKPLQQPTEASESMELKNRSTALPGLEEAASALPAAQGASVAIPTLRESLQLPLEAAEMPPTFDEGFQPSVMDAVQPNPANHELLVWSPESVPEPTASEHTDAVPMWAETSRTLQVPIPVQARNFTDDASEEQQRLAQTGETAPLQFIGTAFKTYLLFEAGERLLLVDQHAAHERVLFDRYMERYQGETLSQRLLAPQLIRLTARDVAQLEDLQPVLADAGFEAEAFDTTSVAVRAIPSILGQNESVRELLLDVLDECQTAHSKPTADRLRRRVAQLACKHAVKAGDSLSQEDVRALLMQMLATGTQPTCPHGRPIVTELTRRELEKRFKRIP